MLANPLLKEAAIGSIILENPFYGKRKPINQVLVIHYNIIYIRLSSNMVLFLGHLCYFLFEQNSDYFHKTIFSHSLKEVIML